MFNRQIKFVCGKLAVITGAGGGLGRALALELARKGCNVALLDLNQVALLRTAEEILKSGVRVSTHIVDITDAEQVSRLANSINETYGGIDFLLNNAGITIQKSFASQTLVEFKRAVDVNLWGVVNCCHAFLPFIRKSSDAHIVNISSMAAFMGLPSQSSYSASKAAVRALSESLWCELSADGVGITCVHPGAIRTDMIKATLESAENRAGALRNYELANRFGVTPQYAANRIVNAIESNAPRIRIGVDAIVLDLVKRVFPTWSQHPMRTLSSKAMKK